MFLAIVILRANTFLKNANHVKKLFQNCRTSWRTKIILNIHVRRVNFLWYSVPSLLWPSHCHMTSRLWSVWQKTGFHKCPRTLANIYPLGAVGIYCLEQGTENLRKHNLSLLLEHLWVKHKQREDGWSPWRMRSWNGDWRHRSSFLRTP